MTSDQTVDGHMGRQPSTHSWVWNSSQSAGVQGVLGHESGSARVPSYRHAYGQCKVHVQMWDTVTHTHTHILASTAICLVLGTGLEPCRLTAAMLVCMLLRWASSDTGACLWQEIKGN